MTVAVIFTSRRSQSPDDEYAAVMARMEELALEQPGFISMTGIRDPATREGITVSYFRDDASARAWKAQAEHLHAQRRGIEDFYEEYSVTVAEVIRDYRFARS